MEDRDLNFFVKKNHYFSLTLLFHDMFTVFLVNINHLFIAFETQNSLQQWSRSFHLTFYWCNLQLRTSQNQQHVHVLAREFLNTYQLQTLGLKLPEVHTGQFLHPMNRETAINKNFKHIWFYNIEQTPKPCHQTLSLGQWEGLGRGCLTGTVINSCSYNSNGRLIYFCILEWFPLVRKYIESTHYFWQFKPT